VTVNKSVATTNVNNGFLAVSAGAASVINLNDTVSTLNGVQPGSAAGAAGVATSGAAATIRISNVMISGNLHGISTAGGGTVSSWGNNYNSDDGTPNGTIMKQ
jgi:hypothetical protein